MRLNDIIAIYSAPKSIKQKPMTRLTFSQKLRILRIHAKKKELGLNNNDIARQFGVNPCTISYTVKHAKKQSKRRKVRKAPLSTLEKKVIARIYAARYILNLIEEDICAIANISKTTLHETVKEMEIKTCKIKRSNPLSRIERRIIVRLHEARKILGLTTVGIARMAGMRENLIAQSYFIEARNYRTDEEFKKSKKRKRQAVVYATIFREQLGLRVKDIWDIFNIHQRTYYRMLRQEGL